MNAINYYAQAISIIMDEDCDYKSLVTLIAKKNPAAVVNAAAELNIALTDLDKAVLNMYRLNGKVEAIKLYRNQVSCSLRDAKDHVESIGGVSSG